MEPILDRQATLVDLLDRVLDKGLVINADVIISVAGIPLIGVNLRAALAGIETMLKYGVIQAWDEKTRAWEKEHRKEKELALTEGEEVILKMFGSYYEAKGIYTAWRPGYFYLTDKRLFLYHQHFDEILFQTPLQEIKAIAIKEKRHFTQEKRDILYLILQDDEAAQLCVRDITQLKGAIEKRIKDMGLALEKNPPLPEFEERAVKFLTQSEQITHRGKMWYLMAHPASGGVISNTWKTGNLYITNKRLIWWDNFDQKIAFKVPIENITASAMEIRDLNQVLKKKRVLDLIYQTPEDKKVASFTGEELSQWQKVLSKIISKGITTEDEIETCPQCHQEAVARELLERGCSECGWLSPRLRQLGQEAK